MHNAKNSSLGLVCALSFTAWFTLAACGAQVTGGGTGGSGANAVSTAHGGSGGNGQGGGGGMGQGGSGTAGSNPGGANAISMLYGELKSSSTGTGTTVASSSGGGPDPNMLYIAISDTPETCNNPYDPEPCGDHYRVSLGIPVALQKVGMIALNDPSIIASFSWAGNVNSPGQCPGGGGSFWEGELEITEIDTTHVAGILTNTSTFDFDANGAFVAPRCVF